MAICKQKRGNKTYAYEYKSVREGKKVKHKFVKYLGVLDKDGNIVNKSDNLLKEIQLSQTKSYGAVAVLYNIAQELNLVDIIDDVIDRQTGFSVGELLVALAINRVISNKSLTKMQKWACGSSLPQLMHSEPKMFSKWNYLSAFDTLCPEAKPDLYIAKIQDLLLEQLEPKLKKDRSLLYDLTCIPYYGNDCALAGRGYNSKGDPHKQIKFALGVTKQHHFPIFHMVFHGSLMDARTSASLIANLERYKFKKVTVMTDRGITNFDLLKWAKSQDMWLLAGVKSNVLEVGELMKEQIPETYENFVKQGRENSIYYISQKKVINTVPVDVIVYVNSYRRTRIQAERNEMLEQKVRALKELQEMKLKAAELNKEISRIVKNAEDYFTIQKSRGSFAFKINDDAIAKDSLRDGKFAIINSNPSLSAREALLEYFRKNQVERAFRVLKHTLASTKVRHRLEERVRANMFVHFLAYYLYSMLEYKLRQKNIKESVEETVEKLNKIEIINLTHKSNTQPRCLNIGVFERKVIHKLGYGELLFSEKIYRV